jgi:hypothetical protein
MTKRFSFPAGVLALALLLALAAPAFAQAPPAAGLTADYFTGQTPLTDADIDFYLKYMTIGKDPAIQADPTKADAAVKELAESSGIAADRVNYITIKVGLGVTLKSAPAVADQLVAQYNGVKEVLPTEEEQALIEKRYPDLLKAASQQ